jgi:hypothetical protein
MNLTPTYLQVSIINSTNQVTCESYAATINEQIAMLYTENPLAVLYPTLNLSFSLLFIFELLYIIGYILCKKYGYTRFLAHAPTAMYAIRILLLVIIYYSIF